MNKKDETLKLLNYYAHSFPNDDSVTPERLEITAEALEGYSIPEIQNAFKTGIKDDWEWFPVPAKIIKLMKPSDALQASESFDKILNHIKRLGSSEKINTLSKLEEAALRAVGGLRGLGMSEENEMKWKRKEFMDAFNMYSEKLDYKESHLIENKGLDGLLDNISAKMS